MNKWMGLSQNAPNDYRVGTQLFWRQSLCGADSPVVRTCSQQEQARDNLFTPGSGEVVRDARRTVGQNCTVYTVEKKETTNLIGGMMSKILSEAVRAMRRMVRWHSMVVVLFEKEPARLVDEDGMGPRRHV
jgi:hypothetical protein